ncbi:MAG: ABC transporter permease subunit [Thermoplasmata archaeon]
MRISPKGLGQLVKVGIMNLGRRALNFFSKRSVSKTWYAFIIIFFFLLVLLPTIYVLSYVFTGWDDINEFVLSDKKSSELYWERNEDSDFLRYEVHMSTTQDFDPSEATLVYLIGADEDISKSRAQSQTLAVVMNMEAGESYCFRVRVVDQNGTWTDSNQLADGGDFRSPFAPYLTMPVVEERSITLSWQPADDGTYRYEVHMSTERNFIPNTSTLNSTLNSSTTSHTLYNLSDGVYYFRISAVSFEGLHTYSNQQVGAINDTITEDGVSPMPIRLVDIRTQRTSSYVLAAVGLSFAIAIIATLIDLTVGLPIAWVLVRKEFRGKKYLNTLIDIPLAVPTAGLGFSVALFWGVTPGIPGKPWGTLDLISSPFLLLILLMVAFSFPYMVRSLAAILEEIDINYEIAARSCGASRLTAARTVTLPLFKAGLVTGLILCLAKTLSETGGVMALLATIGSREKQATALIGTWKGASAFNPTLLPGLAFISILLIIFSLLLLVLLRIVIKKVRFPVRKVWPKFEKSLSSGAFPKLKDSLAFCFLGIVILIPSFFIFGYAVSAEPTAGADWSVFWNSLFVSFAIAGCVTAIVLLLGIPMGIFITRSRKSKTASFLDTIVNIPFIVPTAALGFSLGLFWTGSGLIPSNLDIFLIIMAHVAFTYPFVVRNVVGAMEELDQTYEETARTLGAKPFQVFRRIVFPMIKASILAGAIMTFTRSLGETGATIAVSPKAITAPVYIVRLIQQANYYQAALASIILIVVSFFIILTMRIVTKKRGA